MNRFVILTVLITLLVSSTAIASTDSHRQAVEEMLTVSRVDKMIDPMMDNVMAMMNQQMNRVQSDIPEEKRPILEKYNARLVETLRQELRWESMKNEFVDIYLTVYTEEEIRGLTAFYSSPLGQKMLDKMPELMQATMQVSQQLMQGAMPKVQLLMEEMIKELQAAE